MDEINEQTDNMKQIQEALSAPFGSAADFDEVNFPLSPHDHILFKHTHKVFFSFLKIVFIGKFYRMNWKQNLKN